MSVRKEQLAENVTLWLGDCREVLPALGRVDHIITDPPYSDRTHKGHDGATALLRDKAKRQSLGYGALSADDAQALARVFADAASGWIVWMTDHTLAPAIQQALATERRYVFAPLPFFQPGRSVRLTGDGPCSWTDWIICAQTAALNKWGTLPGGYVAGEGWSDKERMGGKPTRLMSLLVEHYSRRGDVVCDPMMGAGSTGIAAVREGRGFCGIEIDEATFVKACSRISDELRRPRLFAEPIAKPVQQGLFA